MIHIVTVHWKDDRWVDVQLKYLRRFISTPHRVYAFLNHLPTDQRDKFFYSSTEPIPEHSIKLNLLAEIARLHSTDPEDLLMFIDGDAFPVGDLESEMRDKLKTFPLVAVQRRENNGDIQPHPCFSATTVGFWHSIQGDWKSGHRWKNKYGQPVTDVGGNLLKILNERNLPWHPLWLTKLGHAHPMFYGIYGDLVYHHGAGFRDPWSRLDVTTSLTRGQSFFSLWLNRFLKPRIFDSIRRQLDPVARKKSVNTQMSQEVFAEIVSNENFFQKFRTVS